MTNDQIAKAQAAGNAAHAEAATPEEAYDAYRAAFTAAGGPWPALAEEAAAQAQDYEDEYKMGWAELWPSF